jgi:hypothetical protein
LVRSTFDFNFERDDPSSTMGILFEGLRGEIEGGGLSDGRKRGSLGANLGDRTDFSADDKTKVPAASGGGTDPLIGAVSTDFWLRCASWEGKDVPTVMVFLELLAIPILFVH